MSANIYVLQLIEIKSKFEAEFRRFSVGRDELLKFEDFYNLIEHYHHLFGIEFSIFYTDPTHGDLLPINNDDNFAKAISSAKPTLRLNLQRKGNSWEELSRSNSKKKHNFLGHLAGLNNLLPLPPNKIRPSISMPEDFRMVSAIIDVDIVPDSCRRVRLVKHGSDKPLGFYIRDGTSVRMTPHGLEKVPGIFISRLVPGGLAESTGLLAVNDEVLEVNGIEVFGKSLDQVTDMMVANSSNLIITIRPANQRGYRGSGRSSTYISPSSGIRNPAYRASINSHQSSIRNDSVQNEDSDEDEDEVKDHLALGSSSKGLNPSTSSFNSNAFDVHHPPPAAQSINSSSLYRELDENPDDVVTL